MKYPKQNAQMNSPNKFIQVKIFLFLYLLVRIKILGIVNKFRNNVNGKISNPNPNGPPPVNIIFTVSGIK
ncbi:hypothetical protein KK2020170_19230 [Flavobacterium okayamense]|uniref:Uncharacterized protein n=1 Tax=Flavobacterium okayamense TaxID=2830782 RepID=A0ABN6HXF3_9FLAO|nr:hypothetical protein KK2020170_19230 [Flavobacterium okayamense]